MSRKAYAIAIALTYTEYRNDFAAWLDENWHLYEAFDQLAIESVRRGRKRLSAYLIFELIRWNSALTEDGLFKLNNFYRADCARLFDRLNPTLAGRFEFRRRH